MFDGTLAGMSPEKVTAAVVGPGNIGTDCWPSCSAAHVIDVAYMVGVVESDGLARAREQESPRRPRASTGCCARTRCRRSSSRRPRPPRTGQRAALRRGGHPGRRPHPGRTSGRWSCPPVNLREHIAAPNVNMITCGGQATIPMVHAVSPGDAGAVRRDRRLGGVAVGRARAPAPTSTSSRTRRRRPSPRSAARPAGKAIIILNPVEPPMIMRDTVFCVIGADADEAAITASIHDDGGRRPAVRARLHAARRAAVRRAAPTSGRATGGWRCSSRSRATATTCRRTRATSTS